MNNNSIRMSNVHGIRVFYNQDGNKGNCMRHQIVKRGHLEIENKVYVSFFFLKLFIQ